MEDGLCIVVIACWSAFGQFVKGQNCLTDCGRWTVVACYIKREQKEDIYPLNEHAVFRAFPWWTRAPLQSTILCAWAKNYPAVISRQIDGGNFA